MERSASVRSNSSERDSSERSSDSGESAPDPASSDSASSRSILVALSIRKQLHHEAGAAECIFQDGEAAREGAKERRRQPRSVSEALVEQRPLASECRGL